MKAPARFEVHEHTLLNSRMSPAPKVRHSHEGGDKPHQHPDTGPAAYGRSKPPFTVHAIGQQLPWVELEEWQKSFEIIVCDPSPSKGQEGYIGEGPGPLPAMLMVNTFRMNFTIRDGRRKAVQS